MKIGIIYTAKSDELVASLKHSIHTVLGKDVEILEYTDIEPLKETAKNGYISTQSGVAYIDLCLKAAKDGVDGILSTCCVMGDLVDASKSLLKFLGAPVVSIDESFSKMALLENKDLCLVATAKVAAFSVVHTLERAERFLNLPRQIDTIVLENPENLQGDALSEKIIRDIKEKSSKATGVILAQPSMAFLGDYIRKNSKFKVYTAVDKPISDLKAVLQQKGIIK